MNKFIGIIGVIILFGGLAFLFPEVRSLNLNSTGNGIQGIVLIGPQCPVVQEEGNCLDKPYKTRLAVTISDGSRTVKEFDSDLEGKFKTDLPPGEYFILSAVHADVLPNCQSEIFKVKKGEYVKVDVFCDNGIR